jgi:hypothetical protein
MCLAELAQVRPVNPASIVLVIARRSHKILTEAHPRKDQRLEPSRPRRPLPAHSPSPAATVARCRVSRHPARPLPRPDAALVCHRRRSRAAARALPQSPRHAPFRSDLAPRGSRLVPTLDAPASSGPAVLSGVSRIRARAHARRPRACAADPPAPALDLSASPLEVIGPHAAAKSGRPQRKTPILLILENSEHERFQRQLTPCFFRVFQHLLPTGTGVAHHGPEARFGLHSGALASGRKTSSTSPTLCGSTSSPTRRASSRSGRGNLRSCPELGRGRKRSPCARRRVEGDGRAVASVHPEHCCRRLASPCTCTSGRRTRRLRTRA